jgi:hypothetical protein
LSESRRLFTVDEANAALTVVIPMLEDLQRAKIRLDQISVALSRLSPAMRSNGHRENAIQLELELNALAEKLTKGIDEIAAMGIEVKDLNAGLIDFYSLRDGRVVYLCWKLGEDRIRYWHELDTGFAGREPVD